jgi:hypothetical protein
MSTYFKITLLIYGIIFVSIWVYWRVREWREDRIFWRQLKIKLQEQKEEFYKNLFAELQNDPRFMKMVDDMAKALFEQKYMRENPGWDKPPLDRGTLLNRIKQWVINLF